MSQWRWFVSGLCVLCLGTVSLPVCAQDGPADADAPAPAAAEAGADAAADEPKQEMVIINLPENTNLKSLVDFVATRLKLNIVYDATISGRQITLKTTNPVPLDSLRELLDSMLAINGMMLVETDARDILRVTRADKLNEHAGVPLAEGEAVPQGQAKPVVSRVYKLEHAGVDRAAEVLGPFLNTAAGASVVKLPRHDLLIITDFVSNLERIDRLLQLTDQPGREVATRFVPVEHLNAAELNAQVTQLLDAQAKIRGDDAKTPRHTLLADERTNQIIVAAAPDRLGPIEQIIKSLDVSLNLKTRVFRLSVVSPSYLDEVVRDLLGPDKAERLYKAVPEEGAGFLAVTTTPTILEQIDELVRTIDQPVAESQSPIRFYKLQHADAQEVAEAISGITGGEGVESVSIDGVSVQPPPGFDRDAFEDEEPPRRAAADNRAESDRQPASTSNDATDEARILSYKPMNTVIVIAPPNLQPIYEKLIKRLDQRRPQVLVEATVVALDTTDDFSLGVEFSRSDSVDNGTLLNFSQFGLSTANTDTGELTLNPNIVGFNGALLDADIAEVVIQALKTDTRSSVLTRPSVLVNDNAKGELETTDTEPFESINANNQVATTSLGGELETGTKIAVEPSISDGDFLKLKYSISVSSFAGERVATSTGGTLPPGRSTNRVESEVTIPDGTTIVVGGLTREIDSETINSVPFLRNIPIVKYAFSNRETSKRRITIFVFLRPVILRDDKFEDLKVLSGTAAGKAHLPSEFPESLPVEIR